MRISDWSSDVCSSDLRSAVRFVVACLHPRKRSGARSTRHKRWLEHLYAVVLPNMACARYVAIRITGYALTGYAVATHMLRGVSVLDRKSVVSGKSASVSLNIGGSGLINTKKTN